MTRIRLVTIVVVLIAAIAVFVLFVGNPFVSAPVSTIGQQNQILFVGTGFNQKGINVTEKELGKVEHSQQNENANDNGNSETLQHPHCSLFMFGVESRNRQHAEEYGKPE